MNNIIVTIGKDVAAYADVRVPQGTELNIDTLKKIALEADLNEVFTPNWENSNGLRIVCVSGSKNSEDNNICDIQVECGRLDLGMEAELFLKGKISLDQFVANAISLRAIKEEEVDLQPIDVYAEIVDGTIGSVKTKSKHFNGNLVQIDHDCPDDADYKFNGMKVSVFYHSIEKAVGDMKLSLLNGTIDDMVQELRFDVQENGLSTVVENLIGWELSSDEDAETVVYEANYLSDDEEYEISYIVSFERDQLASKEIMANVFIIKINNSDENDREVLIEDSLYLTKLIRELVAHK